MSERISAVVGYLAALCGLRPLGQRCRPAELITEFDLGKLAREPVVGSEHGLLSG